MDCSSRKQFAGFQRNQKKRIRLWISHKSVAGIVRNLKYSRFILSDNNFVQKLDAMSLTFYGSRLGPDWLPQSG